MNRNRKELISTLAFAVAFLVPQVVAQQAPASAPAGTTGLCNDGTYYSGATKKGACRGHKGVKEWYGAPANNEKSGAGASQTSPAPTTPAPTTNQAPEQSTAATPKTQAPGGGPGMVWVNTATNVYHCPGTRYYGKTKAGSYMSEAEARAKGARPDHGNPCK